MLSEKEKNQMIKDIKIMHLLLNKFENNLKRNVEVLGDIKEIKRLVDNIWEKAKR